MPSLKRKVPHDPPRTSLLPHRPSPRGVPPVSRAEIFAEVEAERQRQHAKWGVQDLPSVPSLRRFKTRDAACIMLGIPTEEGAKFLCNEALRLGHCTYAHIVVEELSEAVSAPNDATRRGELVQLAACVVQWIEAIDRRAQ